jgi:hypothetical protein
MAVLPPRWLGRPRGWRPEEEAQQMASLAARRAELQGVDATCQQPGCDRHWRGVPCPDGVYRCDDCAGLAAVRAKERESR